MRQDRLSVLSTLTNGCGVLPVELRLMRETPQGGWETLTKLDGTVTFESQTSAKDVVFDLRQVPFPSEGNYSIQLDVAGEMISERRITASLLPQRRPS